MGNACKFIFEAGCELKESFPSYESIELKELIPSFVQGKEPCCVSEIHHCANAPCAVQSEDLIKGGK